ncbi:hypothetical protein Hanom_Chr08g00720851 [Helianthus anomalus]
MWLTSWREIEQEEFLREEKEREDHEEKYRIARATWRHKLVEEEKRAAKEKEQLRKTLLQKSCKGNNFSSLCEECLEDRLTEDCGNIQGGVC